MEDDVLSFELNDYAIANINSAASLMWSIGGTILSFGSPTYGGSETVFARSIGDGSIQRIVVEVVPEPATFLILIAGFFTLMRKRH